MNRLGLMVSLPILAWSIACAEPPSKEMNQAQGALDAAQAAGADRFAADEFSAARAALDRSEAAVTAGDYRQALSHAIDSRERAQNAARMAVDGRARALGDAERAMAEVAALVARAEERLKDPDIARLARRSLPGPLKTVDSASTALQKARSSIQAGDYQGVTTALQGIAAELQAALATIDAAAPPLVVRRPR